MIVAAGETGKNMWDVLTLIPERGFSWVLLMSEISEVLKETRSRKSLNGLVHKEKYEDLEHRFNLVPVNFINAWTDLFFF